jgi:hypothetical protein
MGVERPSEPQHSSTPTLALPLPGGGEICLLCFHPAAQQTTQFCHHHADMPVLAIIEPVPVVRQAQIQPQFVERGIGFAQMLLPGGAALALSIIQRMFPSRSFWLQ